MAIPWIVGIGALISWARWRAGANAFPQACSASEACEQPPSVKLAGLWLALALVAVVLATIPAVLVSVRQKSSGLAVASVLSGGAMGVFLTLEAEGLALGWMVAAYLGFAIQVLVLAALGTRDAALRQRWADISLLLLPPILVASSIFVLHAWA